MSSPSTDPPGRSRGPDEAFCRNCGEVISAQAELCPECGVRQLPAPTSGVESVLVDVFEGGNPFVAGALSALFPGLGQLYNRELTKALAFVVASILSVFAMLAIIGFVLYPLIWVYAIYDAYRTAERQAEGRTQFENGSGRPVAERGDAADETPTDSETEA